jgi:hypothetical protein
MTSSYRTGLAIERPELGDVLSSMIRDAQSYEQADSFEDWRAEYGYEDEAPQAWREWNAVGKQTVKLERLLGSKRYEEAVNQ